MDIRIKSSQRTSSLNIIIFGGPPTLFPALSVSPAHGLASTTFSFLRSSNDPMFSHPLEVSPTAALAPDIGASTSENIASLCLAPLETDVLPIADDCLWA